MRLLLIALLCPTLAFADLPKDLASWEDTWQFDCNAPFEHYSPADSMEYGGFRYEYTGATVKVRRDPIHFIGGMDAVVESVRLGALAGIKDLEPDTKALLERFLAAFEKADVEAILVGGDAAEDPAVLEQVFAFLGGATKRPVLAIAGNTERAAALNYAVQKARRAGAGNLVNMDIIRRYDGAGFDVVSLAGYHDKAYLHLTGGCIYLDKNLEQAERAAAAADDPVVLLSHGPPRQKGQSAIDYVPGADNVGDPRLTDLITRAKIPFGVFGHILEAAGHGTDLSGKPLPPAKLHRALYLDQGSANPLPWRLNDGTTSYGLAAILQIKGKSASYEILRGAKPSPKP